MGSGTLLTDASRLSLALPVVLMVTTSVRANEPSVTANAVALLPRLTLLSSVQPTAHPGLFRVLELSRYDLRLTSAVPLAMLPVNWVSQFDAPRGVVNRGGRLRRDTVSLWISGASADCYGVVPLAGRCAGRA